MKPIVICGPTASGKTELALEVARQTGGIIISADSRQVYKRLTAGTAKPQGTYHNSVYTVDGVPYYLVDFLEVTDTFDSGSFCTHARKIAAAHPHTPLIFAGGTGMYLHAYFVGMDDLPPGTPQTRAQLTQIVQEKGKEGLHQLLAQKDPASAQKIPPGNVQRTMRALEIYLLTGRPASELKSGQFFRLPDETKSHWVILDWKKELLNARIETRTQQIFDPMCAETKQVLAEGFNKTVPALKSLGYPQALSYLEGTRSRQEALAEIALKTRQYAKRQRTWFNRYTQAQRLSFSSTEEWNPAQLATAILKNCK